MFFVNSHLAQQGSWDRVIRKPVILQLFRGTLKLHISHRKGVEPTDWAGGTLFDRYESLAVPCLETLPSLVFQELVLPRPSTIEVISRVEGAVKILYAI